MTEGSGAGSGSIPLTSGSGSGKPKNMWIQWIRNRNTGNLYKLTTNQQDRFTSVNPLSERNVNNMPRRPCTKWMYQVTKTAYLI